MPFQSTSWSLTSDWAAGSRSTSSFRVGEDPPQNWAFVSGRVLPSQPAMSGWTSLGPHTINTNLQVPRAK